jgi:urease accessory protein
MMAGDMRGPKTAVRASAGALTAMLLFASAPCLAHVDEAESGFVSGLLHPVFGIDHFLAMLSVGIVSAQLGSRHIWAVPSAFVLLMIVGASTGLLGYRIPLLETGIALSVVLLGAAIALFNGGWRVVIVYGFVGFFGFLHGYAHGLEMPKAADPVYYGGGFLVSTVAIHLLGVGIGHKMTSAERYRSLLRHLGSVMAGMGLMIFINLIQGA